MDFSQTRLIDSRIGNLISGKNQNFWGYYHSEKYSPLFLKQRVLEIRNKGIIRHPLIKNKRL